MLLFSFFLTFNLRMCWTLCVDHAHEFNARWLHFHFKVFRVHTHGRPEKKTSPSFCVIFTLLGRLPATEKKAVNWLVHQLWNHSFSLCIMYYCIQRHTVANYNWYAIQETMLSFLIEVSNFGWKEMPFNRQIKTALNYPMNLKCASNMRPLNAFNRSLTK